MKKLIWLGALLMAGSASALAAPDSCERVRSDIEQRIINNGVAESAFTLTVEPNDQNSAPDAQVVGHCGNDGWKILYTRHGDGAADDNQRSASQ
ncbi:DUF1161 domain-containing protein [Metakosakonia massiliensis]|uniref:DUF1161 domain-containing protein n=1 Tax=Phytobacter massiliensis TaxID=1485952 RepID=A0A6N3FZ88_9ENTR|nr:DUF1161 domain-containing protein [Phytobacter massiliensis]